MLNSFDFESVAREAKFGDFMDEFWDMLIIEYKKHTEYMIYDIYDIYIYDIYIYIVYIYICVYIYVYIVHQIIYHISNI